MAPLAVWAALLALGWRSLSDSLPYGRLMFGESVTTAISHSDAVLWCSVAALGAGIGLLVYSGRVVAQGRMWNFGSSI